MARELPQAQTPCRCRLILPITACAVSETSILSTRMTCVPPCRRRRIVSTWAANAFSSRAPADAIMATCRSPGSNQGVPDSFRRAPMLEREGGDNRSVLGVGFGRAPNLGAIYEDFSNSAVVEPTMPPM
jgi:hypothetical protein